MTATSLYIVVSEFHRVSPMVYACDGLDEAVSKAREVATHGRRTTIYKHEPYATNGGVFVELQSFEAAAS